MRLISYILVLVGFCILCAAGYNQYRGIASDPSRWGGSGAALGERKILKQENPKEFQNAMVIHWALAFVILSAGVFLNRSIRREERLYPFSPDFDWKDEE